MLSLLPVPRASAPRLSALHAAAFLGMGVYLPFFPVWLGSRGLDPAAIGVILAVPIVVRILVTAPLMAAAERLGIRGLLLASLTAQTLIYLALAWSAGPFVTAALVALLAVAQASIIPANDLVTMNAVRRDPALAYGRIRVWGSLAFLAANVGAGYVVGALQADAVIWLLCGLPVLTLAATTAAVPPTDRGVQDKTPGPRAPWPRALWWIMGASAFTQATHTAVYAFGSLHWRKLGFSDPVIGYLWAVGVLAEIVLFTALGHLASRRAALWLLATGALAALVRFTVLAGDPGLATTFAMQALHGLSFGATHLGTVAAVAGLLPEEERARAQGRLATLLAVGAAASTVLSGAVYRAAGSAVFLAMVPLALAGLLLTLIAARLMPAQPQRAGDGG